MKKRQVHIFADSEILDKIYKNGTISEDTYYCTKLQMELL